MRIPIYDPFIGSIVTTKKIIKKSNEEIQLTSIMMNRYRLIQFNYGRMNFNHIKDLNDGSKRKLYFSEIKYKLLYGNEWKDIRNKIRLLFNFTCQECNKQFEGHNLNVHHIKEISKYIQSGIGIQEDNHECYGVITNKPWHEEDNLILLCKDCHADKHLHMKKQNIKPISQTINKFKNLNTNTKDKYIPTKISKEEKDEMKLKIRNMFENHD